MTLTDGWTILCFVLALEDEQRRLSWVEYKKQLDERVYGGKLYKAALARDKAAEASAPTSSL